MRHISADDAYMDVALEQKGEGLVIDLNNHEDTLQDVMRQPYVSVGSDGSETDLASKYQLMPLQHPRNLATFPRWLGTYVREQHLMTWEEAIRRMTSLAASTLALTDRGVLAAGQFADIAVFDPKTIAGIATFEDPNHYSVGIRYLFVNGQAVVYEGKPTDALPGRAIRGRGFTKASPQ